MLIQNKIKKFKNFLFADDSKFEEFSNHPLTQCIGGLTVISIFIIGCSWILHNDPDTSSSKNLNSRALSVAQESVSSQIEEFTSKAPQRSKTSIEPASLQTKVRAGENLSKIFKRLRLDQKTLVAVLKAHPECRHLKQLKPGDTITFQIDDKHTLIHLSYEINYKKVLHIRALQRKYVGDIEHVHLTRKVDYIEGTIESSLFQAAKKAGLPLKLMHELTHVFSWDINFDVDLRTGDKFQVLYEKFYKQSRLVATGHILAAEFKTHRKTYRAVMYSKDSDTPKYYNPEGQSMQKAFVRAPVKYSRISSHFSLRRLHPKLRIIRPHRGVDFVAPRGAPIHATGDGYVSFIGRKGGYGQVVILQHGKHYTTLYAHLSRFAKKLKLHSRVRQGQVIGFVGATGTATAEHLHYEFRIKGIHHDPITVKLPKGDNIPQALRDDFTQRSRTLLALLAKKGETL